jgi:hypothetical protein
MKRKLLGTLSLIALLSIVFVVWQRLDPGVRASKEYLLAAPSVRARFGDINSAQLKKYISVGATPDKEGYREYRWYVSGSKMSGVVRVIARSHEEDKNSRYSVALD